MSGEEATTPSVGGEAGEWRGGSMAANRGRAGTAAESATPVVISASYDGGEGCDGRRDGRRHRRHGPRIGAVAASTLSASAKRPPQR
ncbi:Hypothetical protein NTJ_06504 [Nesidiocoris tenuis]|uniref:Uncharacterized protein n=1 Tax=Nesidiocoris tenuis TaxID=355587 RepID=A0ABN7AN98_9HEMI|nr:Hypothetical protein NTJ_06504 [Nesidiocoris tenuis]